MDVSSIVPFRAQVQQLQQSPAGTAPIPGAADMALAVAAGSKSMAATRTAIESVGGFDAYA